MMRVIKNRQTGSQLRLRIDPQQDLVRELIAGGCSGLPKGNVEDISSGVIGDARCFHRLRHCTRLVSKVNQAFQSHSLSTVQVFSEILDGVSTDGQGTALILSHMYLNECRKKASKRADGIGYR